MQLHCICITLQCGGILRSECFLGANSLLLQYSRRGAALPSEPRIFSEDNVRWHICTTSELHIFRVKSGWVTILLVCYRDCSVQWSAFRFPLKLPGRQILRNWSLFWCKWAGRRDVNEVPYLKQTTGRQEVDTFERSSREHQASAPYTDNGWQRTPTLRSPMSPRWHQLTSSANRSPSINVKPPARTPAWNPIRAAQNSVGGPSYTSKVI